MDVMTEMSEQAMGRAVVLSAGEVEGRPWEDLPAVGEGVSHRVLWRSGASMAGIMRIRPGGRVESHAHRRSHHHVWVLRGTGTAVGHDVGPGSYVHVPAGVEHAFECDAGEDLQFLYLYLQAA